jgi:ribosome-binding factor A
MVSRSERLSKLFQKEVSMILLEDLKQPLDGFVTVTKVIFGKDLGKATIMVSIFGEPKVIADTIEQLKKAKGYIKRQLAGRVVMKYMPDIDFELDTTNEDLHKTLEILKNIEKKEKNEQ